jgi:hypothetical protein
MNYWSKHTKAGEVYHLRSSGYDDYRVVHRPTEIEAFMNIELERFGINVWDNGGLASDGDITQAHEYEFDSTDFLIHLLQTRANCHTAVSLSKYIPDTVGTINDNMNRLESKKIRRRIMRLPIVPDIPQNEYVRFRAILKRELYKNETDKE